MQPEYPIMKKFKRIYIEITNVCNLKCSFCPVTGRAPEFMDEKTFTLILDSIRGLTEYLFFHVKGEPLLHPLIGRFLDICHERKFMVNLATNGTLIAEAGEKLFGKPALRLVSFSLHSLEEQTDPVMRTRYLEDIISFTEKAVSQTPVLVEFKLWNLGDSAADGINRIILDYIEERFGLPQKIDEKISSPGRIRLSDRIFLNMANRFSWPDAKSPDNTSIGFCYGLRTQAAILVDGTVVPCCLDSEGAMKLGNIHESSFSDIINSERACNISQGFSNRTVVEEICRKCTYRNRFNISRK